MHTTQRNLILNRFRTSEALNTAALHLEINKPKDPVVAHVVALLRKEAYDLIQLGLKELTDAHSS